MKSIHRLLSLLLLASFAGSAMAGVFSKPERGPAPARVADPAAAAHIQLRALKPGELPPMPATRAHLHVNYNDPQRSAPSLAARPAASCDLSALASNSGAALVSAVKQSQVVECLYGLYSLSGQQATDTFNETKMVTIANAMQASAQIYAGNNSDGLLQLVTFLRAGYYVQYGYPADVGSYGAALSTASRAALDAYFANTHAADVSDDNGAILTEIVILVDSAGAIGHELDNLLTLLSRYDAGYAPYWDMLGATNNVFVALYKGQWDTEYTGLMATRVGDVADALVAFINDNRGSDVGSDQEYLLQNAAAELGRLLSYGIKDPLRPKIKSILDQFTLGQPGGGIYVKLASMVDWYDQGQCAYYDLCNFAADLEASILPAANARDCSPTLRVRSQALTPSQLDAVCAEVGGEESYFHTLSDTGHIPVANDHNDALEMVIFHSSSDYETYSGIIFGNDTNNGGIYLEGDPSDPVNQPRFLAYEAEWVRPTFEVWNLTHEYVHYLDGRFNWLGGFSDYPLDAPNSAVWAIEGFAEHVSWSYRGLIDTSAVTEAANPDKFTLAQVFDTVYSTDYARTYQWGHLANRFMFERHRDDITALNALTRVGNYNPGYHDWLAAHHDTYNAEFRTWLACYYANAGDTASCNGTTQPDDVIFSDGFDAGAVAETECPVSDPTRRLDNGCVFSNLAVSSDSDRIWFTTPYLPAGLSQIRFTVSGGSGDANLYVRLGAWPSDTAFDYAGEAAGNDEQVVINNPPEGYMYLMLRSGASVFSGVTIRADW